MTVRSFPELGVSEPVARALATRGITIPFPIQTLVVGDALTGRDVLAKSQTGSGKTLAFALPIAERLTPRTDQRPQALILVPTRELASQVVGELRDVARVKGLRVAAAYGGVSIREQSKGVSMADILVATPGRLEDLANRRLVRLDGVRILVLDEADRMLDMGFEPQVAALVRRIPKERQTMFFSATLEGAVGQLARRYTRDPVSHEVVSAKATVDEAAHRFVPVSEHGKVDALIELLLAEPGLALVFTRTKRGADRLAARLKAKGLSVAAMHGDLSQAQRERTLARFHTGKVSTLIATDVAARGLDVENIAHVINYDPPADDIGYVHRVGRTARAGATGMG
ncbi:MAG TPA: DEAD/DEAH box helicase, partial [Actinomycetota bacterium]|nr:DEAD/DEAH box helicase [Actinomycetota bacterium]